MVPEQTEDLQDLQDMNIVADPSLTYKLDLQKGRILSGKIDDMEAIMQAIQKCLNTMRYSCVIYSGDYGSELEKLIGQDYDYVVTDVGRVITEALLVDDRVLSITELTITETSKDSLTVSFVANTIFGSQQTSTEVLIA